MRATATKCHRAVPTSLKISSASATLLPMLVRIPRPDKKSLLDFFLLLEVKSGQQRISHHHQRTPNTSQTYFCQILRQCFFYQFVSEDGRGGPKKWWRSWGRLEKVKKPKPLPLEMTLAHPRPRCPPSELPKSWKLMILVVISRKKGKLSMKLFPHFFWQINEESNGPSGFYWQDPMIIMSTF